MHWNVNNSMTTFAADINPEESIYTEVHTLQVDASTSLQTGDTVVSSAGTFRVTSIQEITDGYKIQIVGAK